jgi:hypothetical protein
MKNKETLEEAAENNYYFESDIEMTNYISEMASTGRIPKRWSAFVAKINELYLFKQAERMYSEEEVRKAFLDGQENIDYSEICGWSSKLTEQEWFDQNKKKQP